MEIVGDITDEAVSKYTKGQKSHEKKIREVRLYSGPVTVLATRPLGRAVR